MSYRIGIDARFFRKSTAGLGRYTRELLHGLAAIDSVNQYRVFITPSDLPEWDLAQPNFEPVVVPIAHYTVAEQTKFLQVLYKEKLDLVHFLNFNHPILYRRPFVVTLHDLTVLHFPQGRSQKSVIRRAGFVLAMKRAYSSAKAVIAVSESSAQDATKTLKIPQARMEVIYEGGPERLGEAPFGSKSQVQEFLGRREPYFFFLSAWRPHKGIATLVGAFERFKSETNAPHVLVLCGNQKYSTPELRERVANSSFAADICLPGFVPDELLPLLYRHAVGTVNPSQYEGFGLPILEAFAAGSPVISANNSSLPEVVGNAGILVETGNEVAFAEAMYKLATDEALRADLIAKGYTKLATFSWSQMAKQTLGLYQRVLEKP